MELAFIVWAMGVLPKFGEALLVIGILGSVGTAILGIPAVIEQCVSLKVIIRVVMVCLVVVIIGTLIPDKQTTHAMAAAYGVQTIAQNDKVQEVAGDGVEVLQALMKKAKTELEKE